jgi:myo-inositol 2-dehydrogenase / D-chiro-inositol 1-dehydrogenase
MMKLAVIGCGRQGEKHIHGLRGSRYAATPVLVADIDSERAYALASRIENCKPVSVEGAMADPDVGAVVICTPIRTHVPLSIRAMRAGKHVLCEKPLCDNLEEAQGLLAVSQETGRDVAVGYIYRHAPRMVAARAVISSDSFGNPARPLGQILTAYLRAGGRGDHAKWTHQRATGGGAVNEMLVHMIDLGTWLFGPCGEVQVLAKKTLHSTRTIRGETFQPDTEDFVILKVVCKNGLEYFVQADLSTPGFVQYVDIVGDNGNLFTSILHDFPSYFFMKQARDGYPAGQTPFDDPQRNFYVPQIEAFFAMINGDSAPSLHRIQDTIEHMRIIDAVAAQGNRLRATRPGSRFVPDQRVTNRRSLEG